MREQRLGIQIHPARLIRTFHVHGRVGNANFSHIRKELLRSDLPVKDTYGVVAIDEKTRQLADTLLQHDAIARISIDRTYVDVELNGMFYWHDIQDDIIDAILTRLGWRKSRTDIMSYNDFQHRAKLSDANTVPKDRIAR